MNIEGTKCGRIRKFTRAYCIKKEYNINDWYYMGGITHEEIKKKYKY